MSAIAPDVVIVFVLVAAVLVAFLREWLPPDMVALSAAAVLLATGILTTEEVVGAFGNPGVVTVGAMFVLSAALERTGCIDALGAVAIRRLGGNPIHALVGIAGIGVVASAFVNNTPVVVVLTPVAIRLCQHLGIAPSKLLIPVSYAAIFGGTCTMIGTSTNLVVDGIARRFGLEPFGIFEITGFGVLTAAAGLVYLGTIGHRLLPDRETAGSLLWNQPARQFLTEAVVPAGSGLLGRTLQEARLADRPEARVIDVVRQEESLRRKLGEVRLEPGDRLLIKAAVPGLMSLRDRAGLVFDPDRGLQELATRTSVVAEGIVGPRSSFVGHRLSEFNLRRRYGVYILAVHRQGENLRGRFEDVALEVGDTVLLEGPPEGIRNLVEGGDLINLTQPDHEPVRRDKAPVAAAAVVAVVVLSALEVMPIAGVALVAAIVVVVAGCLTRDEAYRAVEWPILFLILGMLALGAALEKTGAAALIAGGLVDLFGAFGPLATLSAVYFTAMVMTEMISNNAVGVLLTPIAIGVAAQLGVDPRPFVVAVMFAASASFATPVGYQTNTFVYGAGGYRYLDFVRVGLPLNLLFWLLATALIPWFWPF